MSNELIISMTTSNYYITPEPEVFTPEVIVVSLLLLSLHYYGANSYLFVNRTETINFK